MWTQVAPLPTDTETLARKALASESPAVDPNSDPEGMAIPKGATSLQALTAESRMSQSSAVFGCAAAHCLEPGNPGGCTWAIMKAPSTPEALPFSSLN